MKKGGSAVLLIITLAVAAFTLGILLGRFTYRDSVSITVVTRATQQTDDSAQTTSAAQIGKINLNTADLDTLQLLPGIGPALAQRILDYRVENGNFQTIDELKQVSGIGDKSFEALRDFISVGG